MRWLLLSIVLLMPLVPAGAQESCPKGHAAAVEVPHLRRALRGSDQLLIVALGSSSTRSFMASDGAHTYPAVLQAMLSADLPQAHVAVINRGINGQDAAEEVRRLEADVIAIRPQVVIWQVGANGALRNVDPAVFKHLVTSGVKRLQDAGIDVVLMDNQRSPRILAAPEHLVMDRILAQVADDTGASLFSRSALEAGWSHEGTPFATFISADGLHQNDLGYRCVARALAQAIMDGMGPKPEMQTIAQRK